MGINFNADEILEIAERIERNGRRFYTKAAANTTEEEARKLLLELASMEQEHEKTFTELRSHLTNDERETKDYDPYDEKSRYLEAMADGKVFDYTKDPSEMLSGTENISDVLGKAIGLEKDSIVFYLGIKEMVTERLGSARVADIIKEEMRHITVLSKYLMAQKS